MVGQKLKKGAGWPLSRDCLSCSSIWAQPRVTTRNISSTCAKPVWSSRILVPPWGAGSRAKRTSVPIHCGGPPTQWRARTLPGTASSTRSSQAMGASGNHSWSTWPTVPLVWLRVVHQPATPSEVASVDAVSIITEPRRREILRLVWDQERSASEIASHFAISFGAVSQHLGVLRRAGLILVRPDGTRRFYRANRQALQPFSVLLEQMWTNQLDRLAELAEAAETERPR